jgi:magnesium transporter
MSEASVSSSEELNPEPEENEEEEEELFDYFYDEPGSMPGTLSIEAGAAPSTVILIDYNESKATRASNLSPEACATYLDRESVSWVDVQGLGSEDLLLKLGSVFSLHPLVLEDLVNVPQRPKVEDYGDQLVIIARMVIPKSSKDGFWSEQVSFVVGKYYLLTVQEEPLRDCFSPVRDRIRTNKGRVRTLGSDYLAYALLDAIIDGFFPVLEDYGERIEALEDEVILNPTHHTLEKIYQLKRELLALRRAIWPQRSAINTLLKGSDLISADVQIYLRDCYDHIIQVLDMVETYRELATGLMDVYLSSVGNKMNEIMKVLTVISTIFIPLTFIAGVYGMNFQYMPELTWRWGYFACWGIMLAIATALFSFFWRRGWFENFSSIKKIDAQRNR